MTVWYAGYDDTKQVSHCYNNSPDDGHMAARIAYRIEINIHEKLCVKLVIYRDHTRMHGQQNIKLIVSVWRLQSGNVFISY